MMEYFRLRLEILQSQSPRVEITRKKTQIVFLPCVKIILYKCCRKFAEMPLNAPQLPVQLNS